MDKYENLLFMLGEQTIESVPFMPWEALEAIKKHPNHSLDWRIHLGYTYGFIQGKRAERARRKAARKAAEEKKQQNKKAKKHYVYYIGKLFNQAIDNFTEIETPATEEFIKKSGFDKVAPLNMCFRFFELGVIMVYKLFQEEE